MSLLDDKGLKYFVGKLKDMFAPKNHTHDGRYYTESEIDGKLSGKANSSHTHTKAQVGLGNVDNTADSAKSVKAATKLQTYKQGSTTTTYGDSYPLYAQWSGDDVVLKCDNYKVKVSYAENAGTANEINPNNSYGSITKAVRPMFDSVRANRLAFLPSEQIIIEKTVDGGKTWTDAAITEYNKRALFSENGGGFTLPQIDGKKSTLCGIRLTITGMKYNVPAGTAETAKYNYWNSKYVKETERYCTIGDMFFWVSGGSDDISLVIERATGAASTSWANLFTSSSSTGYLNGWSGPNYIKFSENTLGGGTGQTSNWWNYRFTFMSHPGNGSAFNSNYITQAQNVTMIKAYGASVWVTPNNLMSNDHMYKWDVDENVAFPAKVTASGFNGTATKLARDGDLANPMTFNWSGKDGQPTWLWGGEDGSNMYVYNPSKFNVNSAKTAASADSAKKLTTNAGSTTQPVYFNGGKPVVTGYTLAKSVPADAKFTDTTYGDATTSAHGLMTAADKAKLNGIASNANNYSHPTSSGNKHIPAGGSAGQILRWSADGTATWGPDNNTTYSEFKGATSSAAGGGGLVPAPGTADVGKVLKGSGAWGMLGKGDVGLGNVDNTADSAKSVKYATSAGSAGSAGSATNDSKSQAITGYIRGLSVSGRTVTYTRGDGTTGSITTQDTNTTYGNMTGATANAAGKAGLVPAPAAGTQGTKYLRADGTWQTPPDTNTTYGTASQGANGLMSAADKKKLDGIASGANNFTYSLPTASATVLGGVKTGSNITNTSGVLSLTKANVTSALGYTPPTTNTTYGNATTGSSGLMSSSDKSKLDGIASGANKTVVDNALSQGSANPVANSVVTKRLQYLYSFKISRDKWDESSDKSNWNVIVPWSDSSGTALTGSTAGTPNLTTGMSLGPAMMERTSSLKDNIVLSGELSMINQGQIYVCETNKLSFTVKRRPVCDLMLYFYARQWTT